MAVELQSIGFGGGGLKRSLSAPPFPIVLVLLLLLWLYAVELEADDLCTTGSTFQDTTFRLWHKWRLRNLHVFNTSSYLYSMPHLCHHDLLVHKLDEILMDLLFASGPSHSMLGLA